MLDNPFLQDLIVLGLTMLAFLSPATILLGTQTVTQIRHSIRLKG